MRANCIEMEADTHLLIYRLISLISSLNKLTTFCNIYRVRLHVRLCVRVNIPNGYWYIFMRMCLNRVRSCGYVYAWTWTWTLHFLLSPLYCKKYLCLHSDRGKWSVFTAFRSFPKRSLFIGCEGATYDSTKFQRVLSNTLFYFEWNREEYIRLTMSEFVHFTYYIVMQMSILIADLHLWMKLN